MQIDKHSVNKRGTLTTVAKPHTQITGLVTRLGTRTFIFRIDGSEATNCFMVDEWTFEPEREIFAEQFAQLPVGAIFKITTSIRPHKKYVKLNDHRLAELGRTDLYENEAYPTMKANSWPRHHDIEVV